MGGWNKKSWRAWSQDDGDTFSQCVYKYEIDGLIYHSSYKAIEAEINDDGISWDSQKIIDEVNFLEILNPDFDIEELEEIEDEIRAFFDFINYHLIVKEIIAEVKESSENSAKRRYRAKIQGTDKDITEWIYDQNKLKYAFEHSGLIKGKRSDEGGFSWRVIGKKNNR